MFIRLLQRQKESKLWIPIPDSFLSMKGGVPKSKTFVEERSRSSSTLSTLALEYKEKEKRKNRREARNNNNH